MRCSCVVSCDTGLQMGLRGKGDRVRGGELQPRVAAPSILPLPRSQTAFLAAGR